MQNELDLAIARSIRDIELDSAMDRMLDAIDESEYYNHQIEGVTLNGGPVFVEDFDEDVPF